MNVEYINQAYRYQIGCKARQSDFDRNARGDDVRRAISALKEGDGAFVDERYAIVCEVDKSASPPSYIVFQVTPQGRTRKFEWDKRWGWDLCSIVPLNYTESHRPGTDLVPFCPTVSEADLVPKYHDPTRTRIVPEVLHSISAMPVYASKSAEELRLEDYSAGNRGRMMEESLYGRSVYYDVNWNWGASDINTLLEVDLGTQQIVLRKPFKGSMYTKEQCLKIITTATVKRSKERRELIRFLSDRNLVPNETALYKLLQRNEKGCSIGDNNWGMEMEWNTQKDPEPADMIVWKSRNTPEPLPSSQLSKKKIDIGDHISPQGEKVRLDIMYEDGWKAHIRLMVIPLRFKDLPLITRTLFNQPELIDICSYIGVGGYGGINRGVDRLDRICRLYFDPRVYPAPHDLDKGGDKSGTFGKLKTYIRQVANEAHTPVFCNGGSPGKYHSKVFHCPRKFRNIDGKKKQCPFSFQVRWDKYGYYIYLHRTLYYIHYCGSPWHCCKG